VRREVSARTPGCAHRFTLAGARRGRLVAVKVTDTWGIGGIHVRLCARPPARARRCRLIGFPASVGARTVRFRARERGRWRLDLRVRGFHVRGVVGRAGSRPRPVLLATGDSTMQGVDSALSDDLGAFRVVPAVAPGGEISLGGWPKIARGQVSALHPAVVVVSIGATEGFPMTSPDGTRHACCGPDWVAEYVRRARAMMRTYRQGGRARVYWETVALSRDPARAAIVRTINQAFITAANGLSGVTVLRMDLLFSPHGYQDTIRDRGRDVPVREDDGIHLNASGTAIEARETAKAIRAAQPPT
jgi:lysophospholipase L1-like esterase